MNVLCAANEEEFEKFIGAPMTVHDSNIFVSCSSHSNVWQTLCVKGHAILRGHLAR